MNNVRICFLLSLGLHVAFLVVPFPAVKSYSYSLQPGLKDFHLPVTVDLVQESATQSLPAVSPISKPQVSVPRSPDLFLHAITQSFSILSAKKEAPKKQNTSSDPNVSSKSIVRTPKTSKEIWNQPPIYPEVSRRLHHEGRLIIDTQLNDSGDVISAKISSTSGFKELDQAALDAVSQWKLDLPESGSRRVLVPITFQLQSANTENENVKKS